VARALKRRSSSRTCKEQLLEVRVTPDQKRLIERAAELRGTTVTEFVVASAGQAAADTVKDFAALTLRDQASKVFVNAILNPSPPNEAAHSAARRYKAQMGG
jgi:uncharacterized protein (DUF1778 family)